MVATAHPLATRAALDVLRRGGNAVDAAVAAQWMLNVAEPQASGLGGGAFFLFYEASTRRIYAFDGRETAPAKAFPEMFLDKNKKPYPFWPERATGGLPVGVPGALKLLYEVHGRFGSQKFKFAELFEPAIEAAENGFQVSERLSHFIDGEKGRLALFPDSRRIFLDASGQALKAGTLLRQPELAETFRAIQRAGPAVFYEGRIADKIVEAVRTAPFHPGLMEKKDLAYYRVIEREPVQGTYRGYALFSIGPPSSGGTTLIEALDILERFHVRVHGKTPDGIHLLAEAQKIAFQDRDRYLGDPDFVKVPLAQLLSKDYAAKRSEALSFEKALPAEAAAPPPAGAHTSHISIVDEEGNMVAFTTTIEHVFGSAMVVPGCGFFLNNQLTDFDAEPKDAQGRPAANAPGPERRPRSSMTPTFVFAGGKPFLIVGSPGGPRIIGTVLNVIVNLVDFELPLDQALREPRAVHRDGQLEIERELFDDGDLRADLQGRGQKLVLNPEIGNVQAILYDDSNQVWIGESDPRGEGLAEGY